MKFPTVNEDTARMLIRTGRAGYWELSLRDSISKTPIANDHQYCIFLQGAWHLVPVEAFSIKPIGRGPLGEGSPVSAHLSVVESNDDELSAVIIEETAKLGRRLA